MGPFLHLSSKLKEYQKNLSPFFDRNDEINYPYDPMDYKG